MAIGFWHGTMYNSYVSPLKLHYIHDFQLILQRNFALGFHFVSTMKPVPIACDYLAWYNRYGLVFQPWEIIETTLICLKAVSLTGNIVKILVAF